MADEKVIHIAAAVITDPLGRVLLVRKRNTAFFMQPGGKIEAGERPATALVRELHEELQMQVAKQEDAAFLGQFTDIAANEPGYRLIADVFAVPAPAHIVTASAEIEDVIWLSPSASESIPLAPLTQKQLLPLLMKAKTPINP
ncbi:Nudix hydrolase family protein [Candidatus Sodalis pierantonius str. SOPE]|uniref:Nudix hydrolase family protein n=1 Tax=Candidatus Sodalis pierantonii str. SOPE TaxID=2342 RepID=W0HHX1_9GAMM|nr:NUDIX domain-containing protein [Candidatus Sodalis pierantonius]AHF73319.1 Nudix hydrolase family protein [Candidatus Sodalis pierantonius str. SOPE]